MILPIRKYVFPTLLAVIVLVQGLQSAFAQYKQTQPNRTSLLQDVKGFIPLGDLAERKIAVVTTSSEKYRPFVDMLSLYASVSSFDFDRYDENTKYYNTIVVAGTPTELRSDRLVRLRQSAINKKDVILLYFAEGDEQKLWDTATPALIKATLQHPSTSAEGQEQAAMSIFGGLGITEGKYKTAQNRIQYHAQGSAQPAMRYAAMLKQVDAIAEEAIRERATPGMVVMALKDGQVILNKAYGTHTYGGKQATQTTDIFDLASISKIAGTTPVIMHLYEKGLINLDSTMAHYLQQAKASNKSQVTLRSVLLHEAGFTPFIPFYRNLKAGDLQRFPDAQHQVVVADSAYLRNDYYAEVMWPEMLSSPVKPTGNYVYSDISMYVMQEVAEHQTATPIEDYVDAMLFKPIGMHSAGYNPRKRFPRERMVPTEHDTSFRRVLLQGYVHDQGAAMAGGVAGHAGLFATANDLAIYAQMLLNRGEYGGERYFAGPTVDLFTSKQSLTSRRGLGFDRFDPNLKNEYPSKLANESVYGHTGYTGTAIWIDPRNQMVYIFLSNRVHPQVTNKLSELSIRSRILDVLYEFIGDDK